MKRELGHLVVICVCELGPVVSEPAGRAAAVARVNGCSARIKPLKGSEN